ncbi:hypothetical protein ACJIZ3_019575 [Penstemon smallii]|uniref:DUF295 domain-containing protein n=1 Tax=Penstemon smallii TaxID=265156 RepID=A0ABD3T2S9_9LAMI
MADWSELPFELLKLISRLSHFLDDYVRFGLVCKSWRAALLLKDKNNSCSLLPLLMFTENENCLRLFCSPFNNRLYQFDLPEIYDRRCWGSSNGWLVTLDAKYELHLFNPLSSVQILLPSLHKNLKNLTYNPDVSRDRFFKKVVLSSNSSLGNCVVLAIYSYNKIAFAKPGIESWTPLQCSSTSIQDAIYFGGKFYVADSSGDVIIFDSNGIHLKRVALTSPFHICLTYIAELGGQIHVVRRSMYYHVEKHVVITCGFKVYKLDQCSNKCVEVKTLGNWSIFVGSNYSFSISGTGYPECISNCIYFTDHYGPTIHCPYDMGTYSLDTDDIKPLFQEDLICLKSYVPTWIKPSW